MQFKGTSRRGFLSGLSLVAASGAAGLLGRDFGPGAPPVGYPDPDIVALEPEFQKYIVGNTAIQRLFTGCLWAEGCAWNATGNYLVWSDIPNNRQMRWLAEDGHVSVLRSPSNNSNGNTFDWHGRQLSAEHLTRRVTRYERDGTLTVLADQFEGKPFNAPNDVVVHPDGGVWFTDPGYGIMGYYEGEKAEMELKTAVYRIDPTSGKVEKVTDVEDRPNGLCFSPDYKKLYVVDTGEKSNINVYEVKDGTKLGEAKEFVKMRIGEKEASIFGSVNANRGGTDGIRCDIDGNVWATAGWAKGGFNGVHVFTPEGKRMGLIRLPETAGNLCFGGPKRNRLFVVASQSLYSVYVNTRGAHFC